MVNASDSKVILRRPQIFKHILEGFVHVFDMDGAASNSFLNYSGSYQTRARAIVVGVGIIEVGLGKLLKEASRLLDKDIVDRCIYKKDAEDIVTSAFRILEERIRTKIGASPECHGVDLVAEAFHVKTGKLIFGKTQAEREGLFHLFRSSILFLRNPPSHRFIREYSEFEIFEIVCLVNLLLNVLDKCQLRK